MNGKKLALCCPKCGGIVAVPEAVGEIVHEEEKRKPGYVPINEQTLVATCDCGRVFRYKRFTCSGPFS